MNRVFCAVALTFALAVLVRVPTADANTITLDSAPFTFAFSAVDASPQCWSLESTGNNSPYTQGDFSLTPGPTGDSFSHTGPIFTNRVLADGIHNVDPDHNNTDGSGWIDVFSLPILASYTGATPVGATNVKLEIELTNLSIYGVAYAGGTTSLAWNEATLGHSQTSSALALTTVSGSPPLGIAGNYQQLLWNPDDYYVAGTSATRTFNFGGATFDAVDGLEVMGCVHMSYQTIPEPSTLSLVVLSLIGLLAYAWRKHK